jgi:disulfide bond formation protein DsbB
MTVDTVTTFLALLAIIAGLAATVALIGATVSAASADTPRWVRELRDSIGPTALWLGFAVAAVATAGSLYLSEVAKFPPCELCWYQRIAMYPQVLLLGVAAVRRDTRIWVYSVPLAAIGAAISIYHYLLERFPDAVAHACSTDIPCETVWVWKFHFLSIPAMAGIGFAAIIAATLTAAAWRRAQNPD